MYPSVIPRLLMSMAERVKDLRSLVYEDLAKAGVVDPTKVVRQSLENAASISGLLLTTEASVAEIPKEDDEGHGHHHHH